VPGFVILQRTDEEIPTFETKKLSPTRPDIFDIC
jgi:hypothetical protein